MPIDKMFKTIEEQIEIQKQQRKLKIHDKKKFKDILSKINYFDLINGFETLLLKDENDKSKGYLKSTSLKDFLRLYNFDKNLNRNVMSALGSLEQILKTKISYYFSQINSNNTEIHISYLDKNYYNCPAVTSYEGEYFYDAYQKDKFVFFRKYRFNGSYYKVDRSGTFTYADFRKSEVSYLRRYSNPPLWVIIKQLTFGDIFTMMGLLKPDVLNLILRDFSLNTGDREYLLNCLKVLKELRNHCAHFELLNRFRTPGNMNLKIIGRKIDISPKSPTNSSGDMYRIPLFDVIKILGTFVAVDDIIKEIFKFYCVSVIKGKKTMAANILERMGNSNIRLWLKLKK